MASWDHLGRGVGASHVLRQRADWLARMCGVHGGPVRTDMHRSVRFRFARHGREVVSFPCQQMDKHAFQRLHGLELDGAQALGEHVVELRFDLAAPRRVGGIQVDEVFRVRVLGYGWHKRVAHRIQGRVDAERVGKHEVAQVDLATFVALQGRLWPMFAVACLLLNEVAAFAL